MRTRSGAFVTALLTFICAFSLLPSTLSLLAAAQPAPPVLTGPVNDFAKVIDPNSERELERLVAALRTATEDVIVIATVPTFQPYPTIEEYAVKMFENGGKGIGERSKDNGLLIVVAVEDRRVRIETGYELEGFIPDGYAGQTIREQMLPAFRQGQYGRGLIAGTTRLVHRIAEQRGASLTNLPEPPAPVAQARRTPSDGDFPGVLVFIVLLLVFMLLTRRRRRRRRYWGGGPWSGWNSGVGPFGGGFGGFGGGFGGFGGRGGGGGGFGGFGGGRSGGGGASGGW